MKPLRTARLPGGGSIVDIEGDLMTAKDSLAHCVSACLGMGKGIALAFRNNFGNVDALKAQNVGVPGVAILPRPEENRFLYYLITKPKYHHKPTYDTLRASLQQMIRHMVANSVASVSVPELGCGLDGLQWDQVYAMLLEEFKNTAINVTVYHYNGGGRTQTAQPTLPGGAAPTMVAAPAPAAAASSTGPVSKSQRQQQNQQQQQQQRQASAAAAAALSVPAPASKNPDAVRK